jgi:hypothetical protein
MPGQGWDRDGNTKLCAPGYTELSRGLYGPIFFLILSVPARKSFRLIKTKSKFTFKYITWAVPKSHLLLS